MGNSVTTFVLQLLGLETGTLNTVQYSNHAGYRQLKGFRTSATQIGELFEGLKMNGLVDDFDMMLTGYVPDKAELEAVGRIAKEMKRSRRGCFWCEHPLPPPPPLSEHGALRGWAGLIRARLVLDPVMGDQGRLYVSEAVVPVYRGLLEYADLIVPNQFEAE